MKKHLIAAAVAAAVAAPAMAQVSIYGILGTGYDNIETKISAGGDSATSKTSSFGTQNLQAGNRIGFRGTEDLGGGLKAGFVAELHFDMQNSGFRGRTAADEIRQSFVSLSGGFGEVRVGRGNSLSKDVYDTYHTHGGGNFRPGNQGQALAGILAFDNDDLEEITLQSYHTVRHSNIVTYISPSLSGFTLRAQYGQDKTQTTDNGLAVTEADTKAKVQNIGANYNAGPVSIGYAHDVSKTETPLATTAVTKRTTDIAGASYDLGVAKLFAAHTRAKFEADANSFKLKDTSIGVTVPLGATTLLASFSDGDIKGLGYKIDTQGYQLGANYALSKRTLLLARYGDSEAKILDVKGTIDGFAIGIQHSF
jgi:predicted porin